MSERKPIVSVFVVFSFFITSIFCFFFFFLFSFNTITYVDSRLTTDKMKQNKCDSPQLSKSQHHSEFQTNNELCEINYAKGFAFLHPSDLESRLQTLKLVPKCRIKQYLTQYQVWTKSVHVQGWMHANVKVFDIVSKTAVTSLVNNNSLWKMVPGCST